MAEYSRVAKGSFTAASGQTSAVVPLPFTPDYVEVFNITNIGAAATAGNVLKAYWDNNVPPYTPAGLSASQTWCEVYATVTGGVAVNYDTIYTNGVTGKATPASGISAYQAGQLLQYGTKQQIASSTKASNLFTTASAHGYNVGDTVILQGIATGTTNTMQIMNGIPFTISAVTSNTFTVKWNMNQTNYTDISGSPSGAYVQKVLYPFLYCPEQNVVSAITLGTTTTIQTTMYHNFEVGQEIAFRIPKVWGTTQLNSLPDTLIPGSPIYAYVTSVTDNWTFVCTTNSAAFTAYTSNFTIGSSTSTQPTLAGLTYPQVVASGDVNTGGNSNALSLTNLYPSPQFPTSSNRVSTINGPAIKGAFVNNTLQGFVIGNGTPQEQGGTGTIVTSGAIIYWRAYLSDFANP